MRNLITKVSGCAATIMSPMARVLEPQWGSKEIKSGQTHAQASWDQVGVRYLWWWEATTAGEPQHA